VLFLGGWRLVAVDKNDELLINRLPHARQLRSDSGNVTGGGPSGNVGQRTGENYLWFGSGPDMLWDIRVLALASEATPGCWIKSATLAAAVAAEHDSTLGNSPRL
jgi:hypothetical protein